MILCVGAAGNGKSTTLAAIVNHINRTRRAHIVTIEDPLRSFSFSRTGALNMLGRSPVYRQWTWRPEWQ